MHYRFLRFPVFPLCTISHSYFIIYFAAPLPYAVFRQRGGVLKYGQLGWAIISHRPHLQVMVLGNRRALGDPRDKSAARNTDTAAEAANRKVRTVRSPQADLRLLQQARVVPLLQSTLSPKQWNVTRSTGKIAPDKK